MFLILVQISRVEVNATRYLCTVNTVNKKQDIRKLGTSDLEAIFEERGEKKFRARQVLEWIWVKSTHTFDEMSN